MSEYRSFMAGCLILLLVMGLAVAADNPENVAQTAAESWLRLVDDANYASSWGQGAKVFKDAVTQAEWGQAAGGARTPLGEVVSRKLKSREYTEKPPTTRVIGGKVYTWGDGRYVVIQYDTVFKNRASAVETVISMAEPDGAWRVSGYSVR